MCPVVGIPDAGIGAHTGLNATNYTLTGKAWKVYKVF